MAGIMNSKAVRTTIALPASLLAAVDKAVADGAARSRNDLFTRAIHDLLAAREREIIDADFALMSTDEQYQAEATALVQGFDQASWEALRQAEI
ncbi:MAG TPA: ribbon-helix-helix protein, CopG family [Chloroflexota bacterium]|nr:ribbon-helix-helix protein, CopG family [Chloroflexota bacterium]